MEVKDSRIILVEDSGHLLIGEGDAAHDGGEEGPLVSGGLSSVEERVDVMADLLKEYGFLEIRRAI
jgi:hypothetical protein